MFDDMTDEEYAEWKNWFDAGCHHSLACIVVIVMALFVVLIVVGGGGAGREDGKTILQQSVAATNHWQDESPDE